MFHTKLDHLITNHNTFHMSSNIGFELVRQLCIKGRNKKIEKAIENKEYVVVVILGLKKNKTFDILE